MEAKKNEKTIYIASGNVKLPKNATDMEVTASIGRKTVAVAPISKEGKYELSFEHKGPIQSPVTVVASSKTKVGGASRLPKKQTPILPQQWKNNSAILQDIDLSGGLFGFGTRDIIIHGIVCKETPISGSNLTKCCAVPYAEIEVFDVDPNLYVVKTPPIDPGTLKIPKLVTEKPPIFKHVWPPPPPPPPIHQMVQPQKISEMENASLIIAPEMANVRTQEATISSAATFANVGAISIGSIGRFIPSYSTQSLGKTVADKCGEFEITIKWPNIILPFGDEAPDLLFKVTQTVGPPGQEVTNTLVSEGYFDTHWDVPDYVYVQLDAAEGVFVACNPDCTPFANKRVLFNGIGQLTIYDHIAQPGNSLGHEVGYAYEGDYFKSPFGGQVKVRAKFGSKIEEAGERYYKISYAPVPSTGEPAESAWKPIAETLVDTSFYAELKPGVGLVVHQKDVGLGPQTLTGSDKIYYMIRNSQDDQGHDVGWMDENKIAIWDTTMVANGLYVLKIEVVLPDEKTDNAVHYGDDEGNYARMYVAVNNKEPIVEVLDVWNGDPLLVLPISRECGSFTHKIGDEVKFRLNAYHEDNHLLYWAMDYSVGYNISKILFMGEKDGYLKENFRGKVNEDVVWPFFDEDFNLVQDNRPLAHQPPKPAKCDVFGVAVTLKVQDKITNGDSFLNGVYNKTLGIWQYHYKEITMGFAVAIDRPSTP